MVGQEFSFSLIFDARHGNMIEEQIFQEEAYMRGYIEVSKNDLISNASRPGGVMEACHTSVKYGGVKKTTKILRKHGAIFSHYVNSVRNGLIAVYVIDDNNVYISFRLKNYPRETLARIQQNLTTI